MEVEPETYEDFRLLYSSGKLLNADDFSAKIHVWNRLVRILNWTCELLEDFVPHVPSSSFYSEAKIRQLLYLFRKWKENIWDKESNQSSNTAALIAYSIAKICFWDWVENSQLVCEVLGCIYECDEHFSGIFTRVIDHSDRRMRMWYLSRNSGELKEHGFAVYFLHHAMKNKLTYRSIRFVDLQLVYPMDVSPVVAAAVYLKPKPLLLLLRYGAFLHSSQAVTNTSFHNEWDLSLLLRHLLRMLWSSLGNQMLLQPQPKLLVSANMQNVCLCLRILLRATKQVYLSTLRFSLLTFETGHTTKYTNSEDFIRWVSELGLVPLLSERCYDPAQLQHLCRCRIRETLNSSWSLPTGIYSLNLPSILRKYLDLFED